MSDFSQYKVTRGPAFSVDLGETTLKTLDAPSGGPVLGLIMNILRGWLNNSTYHEMYTQLHEGQLHCIQVKFFFSLS